MTFEFHELAANPTLFQSTLMFFRGLFTSVNGFFALATFHQTVTHGTSFASRLFMLIKTLLTLEHPMTTSTTHPGHLNTAGRKPTTLTGIRAPMMIPIVVTLT